MGRDLVERARKGDHDAFAELAGAAISSLDATAWLILRDRDRAMDAVQNALVHAWRDLPTLRDPDRFEAWLRRLLVHACFDELRRDHRHPSEVAITEIAMPSAIGDAASAIVDRDELERGFRRLDPEERAVIVLRYFLDLPLPEIATTLRIPLGTAKTRLYRGLREMRAALDADARPGPGIHEGRPA